MKIRTYYRDALGADVLVAECITNEDKEMLEKLGYVFNLHLMKEPDIQLWKKVPEMDIWIDGMIDEVEELNNAADGYELSADMILDEMITLNGDTGYEGSVNEIFEIWRQSSDKESLERMFEVFAGERLDYFLQECKRRMG